MNTENDKIALTDEEEALKAFLSVDSYKIGSFTFDVPNRTLNSASESTKLTKKEAYLLALFAGNANNFLDRKAALRMIWKDDNYYNSRSMDVYICKLRKLLRPDENVHIVNYHGKGYKLITPE